MSCYVMLLLIIHASQHHAWETSFTLWKIARGSLLQRSRSDRKISSSPPAFVACGMIPSSPVVNIPIHLLVPRLMARSPGLHVVGRFAVRGTRPETGAVESSVHRGRLSIWQEAGKGFAALRWISSADAAAAATEPSTFPLHASFCWSHCAASSGFVCTLGTNRGGRGYIHLPPCFQHYKFTVTPP